MGIRESFPAGDRTDIHVLDRYKILTRFLDRKGQKAGEVLILPRPQDADRFA